VTTIEVFQISAQLASIGAAVDAAEILATGSEYGPDGMYSWALMRTNHRWSTVGSISKVLDTVFGVSLFKLLMVGQITMAILVVTRLAFPYLGIATGILFVLRAAIHLRHQLGLDGSDQMNAIVLGALTLGLTAPAGYAKDAAIWFIAFEALLSYFAAGVAKAVSPVWRSGSAIQGIISTRAYGKASAASLLLRAPRISLTLCWSTIIFECTFPFAALASPDVCIMVLAAGVMFHVSIAATMGLNNFVWAFVATYPAVFQTSLDVNMALHQVVRKG
jgi:hypothetical protein